MSNKKQIKKDQNNRNALEQTTIDIGGGEFITIVHPKGRSIFKETDESVKEARKAGKIVTEKVKR